MPWLIKTNLVFLFLFSAVFFLPLDTSVIGRIIRSTAELSFIFFLPGINLAFLLQYFLKRKFSLLELINTALVFSLFLLPFFLTFEYTKWKILSPFLPFINALLIFILTVGVFFFHKKRNPKNILELPLSNKTLLETFFSKSFLLPFVLYITIVTSIVTSYYPLPYLDPYYWISEYQTQLRAGTITLLNKSRPLFSSLTYIFTQGAHIDFYAYFKYTLPSFLLLLIFPSALLAQKFSHPLQKIIIFLFPFASGITIIFLTLPIPQAIASIGLFFFFSRTESLIRALWSPHPNFLFPQQYVNIDGNQMGWGDFFGVVKYYLFYIGPALLVTFFIILCHIKDNTVRALFRTRESKVLIGIFLVFFTIAEILPRLTGIALLPDRAWVFAGMIALFFLITLFFLPLGRDRKST